MGQSHPTKGNFKRVKRGNKGNKGNKKTQSSIKVAKT
jgi:hypothetical protein